MWHIIIVKLLKQLAVLVFLKRFSNFSFVDLSGIPSQIVMDAGVENVRVHDIQVALRSSDNDAKAGYNSVIITRSTSNQVIFIPVLALIFKPKYNLSALNLCGHICKKLMGSSSGGICSKQWLNAGRIIHRIRWKCKDFSIIKQLNCASSFRKIFQFCFLPVLQQNLDETARLWNTFPMRKNKNSKLPAGKPDVIYCSPEFFGKFL